jgi:hypothetical protein
MKNLLGILILFTNILTFSQNSEHKNYSFDNQLKSSDEDTGLVVFDMSHSGLLEGMVDIPVFILSPFDVKALDFSLKFNCKRLEYNNIINNSEDIKPQYYYNENDSILRFTSYSFKTYKTNQKLLSIRFKLKETALSDTDLNIVKTILGDDEFNDHIVPYDVTPFIITGIADNIVNMGIKICPNPASSILNINVPENAFVQFFDTGGKQVGLTELVIGNQTHSIDINDITAGLYLVKIFNENIVKMEKLLINR